MPSPPGTAVFPGKLGVEYAGMTDKVGVPPIKSQGIKTKLVPWIKAVVPAAGAGTWIEPFLGTGAVAFNIAPRRALLCDSNPHLIRFYAGIAQGGITPERVGAYLAREGALLAARGEEHYYRVRDRFNTGFSPLDFLFLNRAGFNGMVRFNRKGGYNTPFCRKPQRFAPAYITKIVNQVAWVSRIIQANQYQFRCQDFTATLAQAGSGDIVYCDPPYIDRHGDYYNGWDAALEYRLFERLADYGGRFILSTWQRNDYRENGYMATLWSRYRVLTRRHFYHVGGRQENRNPVTEALVLNFAPDNQVIALPEPERIFREGGSKPLLPPDPSIPLHKD